MYWIQEIKLNEPDFLQEIIFAELGKLTISLKYIAMPVSDDSRYNWYKRIL